MNYEMVVENKSDFEITKHTRYLAIISELQCVYCEYLQENDAVL